MEIEIKLSQIDKKLLAYLYHNSREPATKIAKALHLSREQVAYRISKFEKDGVIKGYMPIINYSRLGYHLMNIIFFKFSKPSQIEAFKQGLKRDSNRITSVELMAKYDLAMVFLFKDEKERNKNVSEILQKYNGEISDYLILEPYLSELYPLKFLGSKEANPNIVHEYKQKEYNLDEKEKKIISALGKNANEPIIEISRKTNLSAELIVYKLRKLKEEKVLISTRAYFDMEKIGYFYSILLLNLGNLSVANQNKLKQFARQNENVDTLSMFLGKPNAYFQIFHKELSELHRAIEELKKAFQNEPVNLEIIPLKNEGEDINSLPFL